MENERSPYLDGEDAYRRCTMEMLEKVFSMIERSFTRIDKIEDVKLPPAPFSLAILANVEVNASRRRNSKTKAWQRKV